MALLSSFCFFDLHYQGYQDLIGEECLVEGIVIKRRIDKPYENVLLAQIHSINGIGCRADVYLKFPYASAMQPGDHFSMTGTATAFESEHGYNEEQYALSDGVLLCITCEDSDQCQIPESGDLSLRVLLAKWNKRVSYRLESAVKGEEGKLASALLLGTREHLSDLTVLQFRRAGISHLLALSGLHVSILIAFLEFFLRKLRVPKSVRIIGIFTVALFYLFFTGASPSTTRAVLMLGVLTLGYLVNAQYDSFTALSFVLVLILLVTPYSVLDIGMWMSFLAAGSIIIFMPILQNTREYFYEKWKGPRVLFFALFYVVSALFVGTVANMGLMLFQALTFREFSLASVPATFVLSFPVSALLVLSIFTMVLPWLVPLTAWVGRLILTVAEHASEYEAVLLPLGDAISTGCLFFLTLSMLWITVTKQKHALRSCALPIVLSVATVISSVAVSNLSNDGVCVTIVHESGGELMLFTQHTQSVAVDFSDGTATGGSMMAEYAYDQRCTVLDDLILSHYHNRDTYFLRSLASEILLKRLHLPPPQNDWERAVAMRLEEEAEAFGIEVVYGIGDLAIPELQISKMERYDFQGNRHMAFLFAAEINGRRLTYVNGSILDSNLREAALRTVCDSEILVLGDTGYSTSSNAMFSYLALTGVERILLTDQKLCAMLPSGFETFEIPTWESPEIFFLK
jgi:ComEC/Rec2-related protein